MKDEIRNAISRALQEIGIRNDNFVVEHPGNEDHGDYATNAALIAVKGSEYKSPRELAERLASELKKDSLLTEKIEKVEVAGAGFINFRLSKKWLLRELAEIAEKRGDYGRGLWAKGRKVLVEYSSPNIAKEFSVGHLRSTIIGQAIYNLYRFGGAEVVGDNHLGDWGTQFGMVIAAVEDGKMSLDEFRNLGIREIEKIYVEYNRQAKEDEALLEKAREAFVRLEQGDKKARGIWEASVEISMREFAKIYDLLGVKIDHAYGESHYEQLMPEVIADANKVGIAKQSEGATIIEFPDKGRENFGGEEQDFMLPPAMLLKSNGTTTYFTRDLATIKFREVSEELKADLYIYEVGAEQKLHFRQVFAAAEKLWGVKERKFKHVAHGLVLGEDGRKMSTRRGTGVRMEELLARMIEKAAAINPLAAKEVGVGAVKFFDLKHAPETSYRFDWDEALRLEGDSGPYVQYAVVRARSVLKKASDGLYGGDGEVGGAEETVLRWLYRFPEVVEEAAGVFSPNILCEYLVELSRRFNAFYNQEQIIGSDQEAFRLGLTKGVAQVLENGLGLLGIEVPLEM